MVGKSFLIPHPKYGTEHLYIVIGVNEQKMLMVNLTTHKDNKDTSCVIERSEHPFVKHKSVVNFLDAIDVNINDINALVDKGPILPHDDVSAELLEKIRNSAQNSPYLKQGFLKYLY